jgi:hypothetical protein
MAKIDIPFLVGKPTKSGRINWYWQPSAALKRAGWKPVGLGQDADAAMDAARGHNRKLAEWKAGGEKPAVVKRLVRPQTVSALVRMYREEGYPSIKHPGRQVAPATQKEYQSKFRTIEAWAGDAPIAAIDAARVAVLRDALMKPALAGRRAGEVRHTSAHATLRVLRTLFAYAEAKRLIPKGSNPAEDFGLSKPEPRDQIWWPPAREALLETAAPDANMALAIDLAFSIGQREADLLRLAITQYAEIPAYKMDADVHAQLAGPDGRVMGIRLRQAKGKRWVEVPLVGATRDRIEREIARAKKHGLTTILFDERPIADDGQPRPWGQPNLEAGQRRFIRRFAELRDATIARLRRSGDAADAELAAEIEDLQYRDFRRTAVVTLGELNVEAGLIAAITGHDLDTTMRILDTYMPRTTGMAARAVALSRARAVPPVAREKQA